MMTDEELLSLNERGMIPGPGESEQAFLARIEILKEKFPFDPIPDAHWNLARLRLRDLFSFEPECCFAFYSNRSLRLWQGAATWIEEGKMPIVQLRKQLQKGSYWGYGRSEILCHEAVHAARAAFNEPMGEEFFAYATSAAVRRRMLGPILRRPGEAWVFLASLAAGLFFPSAQGVGVLVILAALARLATLHWTMGKASRNLCNALGNVKKARAILFRLTDAEIRRLACGENFFSLAEKQNCLRWRLLRLMSA